MSRRLALAAALLLTALAAGAAARPLAAQEAQPEQTVRQALGLAAGGDLEGAIELLEPLAADPGSPPQVAAILGALHLEAGRPSRALEILRPLTIEKDADPAALFNAGRAALALGLEAEAEDLLKRSAAIEPNTPAARELGLLLARQGRFANALPPLRGWARSHPDDTEARVAAALAAVQLKRAPEAEELLSDLPQDLPEVRLLWGKLLLLKGELQAAITTLRPLVAGGGAGQRDARRAMAEAHLRLGQAAQAIELLADREAQDPAGAVLLAQAYYQSGDVERGLATLEPHVAAGAATPSTGLASRIALEYGRLLIAAGRHSEALPHLEAATRQRPDDKLGWQALAQALAAAGRREEARAALERFQALVETEVPLAARNMQLERDINDPAGPALNRALSLMLQERYEEALETVRQEGLLSPDDIRPPLLESRILVLLGLANDAVAVAERAIAMEPDNADTHYQRGTARMALRDFAGAETDLRRALELAPEHTAAMSDLAVLLAVHGRTDEARRLLERILELRPDDQAAAKALSELEARAGG